MLVATTGTGLRGVTRVNSEHADTPLLPFVGDELIQLCKCPTVQTAFVLNVLVFLASSHFGRVPDTAEVLKDKSAANGGIGNDAFGDEVIARPVESRLLATQLLEVLFRRFCSFGLQFSFEAEATAVNLFPTPLSQELMCRSHGWTIESQVDSDDLLSRGNIRFRDRNHHMQPVLATAVAQISRGNRISLISGAEVRDSEREGHLPIAGRYANGLCLPIEGVGFLIVADRTEHALWHLDRLEAWLRLALLPGRSHLLRIGRNLPGLPCKSTFEGFRCLDTGLDEQVRNQPRTGNFHVTVRRVVQPDPVLFVVLPTVGTHLIIGLSELHKRLLQGLCLFRCWMKLYLHRSVHTNDIPYMVSFCKYKKGERAFHPRS